MKVSCAGTLHPGARLDLLRVIQQAIAMCYSCYAATGILVLLAPGVTPVVIVYNAETDTLHDHCGFGVRSPTE